MATHQRATTRVLIQDDDLPPSVVITLKIITKYVTLLSHILGRSYDLKLYLGQNLNLVWGLGKVIYFV